MTLGDGVIVVDPGEAAPGAGGADDRACNRPRSC